MTDSIVPPVRPPKAESKPVLTREQPFCIDCAEVAFNELELANSELAGADRQSRDLLRLRAKLAARMVRFRGEWVCRNCERIDLGSPLTPRLVPLGAIIPNRESRRSFERWARTRVNEEGIR